MWERKGGQRGVSVLGQIIASFHLSPSLKLLDLSAQVELLPDLSSALS